MEFTVFFSTFYGFFSDTDGLTTFSGVVVRLNSGVPTQIIEVKLGLESTPLDSSLTN